MAVTTNGEAPLNPHKVEAEAQHLSNGSDVQVNAWSEPGPAAFDFRSMSVCPSLTPCLPAY